MERWRMRFLHEMWQCQPWPEIHEFYDHVTEGWLRLTVNMILDGAEPRLRGFAPGEEEDVLRVLVHRYTQLAAGRRFPRESELIPDWVYEQRDRTKGARAATLAVSG